MHNWTEMCLNRWAEYSVEKGSENMFKTENKY